MAKREDRFDSNLRRLTRRDFVTSTAGMGLLGFSVNETPRSGRSRRAGTVASAACIFSKHLQWLDYDRMAETVAEIGFDGVDLTVRPEGHVEPANVRRDLPRAHAAVRKAGLELPMITTSVTDPDDPVTSEILQVAAELGIRSYRIGYFRYKADQTVAQKLLEVRPKLQRLAELNEKAGIVGDYQNHAGTQYFGARIWDLLQACEGIDRRWLGFQFDPRHATVEGAASWLTDLSVYSRRIHSIAAKDFRWERQQSTPRAVDCPLGEGVVQFELFFSLLAKTGFRGPVSLHCEYPLGGADHGEKKLTISSQRVRSAMKRDLTILRSLI